MIFMYCRYSGSTFYSSPITGYSSPFGGDISGHSWEHLGSFHDPSIHSDSTYTFNHEPHDLDLGHHEFEHQPSNFGHYFSHQSPHDTSSGGSESHGDTNDSSSDSAPSMSPTYRRIGKHRGKRASKQQNE